MNTSHAVKKRGSKVQHSSNLKVKKYKVLTSPHHNAFFGGVFGQDTHPLCDALGPSQVPECENAVAATGWTFEMTGRLYGLDGNRQTIATSCDINMLLPKWETLPGTKGLKKDTETVRRFLSATETHERGHGQACTSLSNITKLLAETMPPTIPADKVENVNAAFSFFVHHFYKTLARKADEVFDKDTHHGAKHEAGLSDGEDSSDEEDLQYMFYDTLPGEDDEI